MNMKAEMLSFAFGALVIFVTFGDSHLTNWIGNLDTIFGLMFWQALDVVYPVATIVVFLLYGWVKGGRLHITLVTVLVFASFLATLALINIDDLAAALHFTNVTSKVYWTIMLWVYPLYAFAAFFVFGKLNQNQKTRPKSE